MIYAIVTIYNPALLMRRNIIDICKQVDYAFLCDNSQKKNEEMFKDIDNASYLFWGENLGLSKAFNRVLKDASIGFQPNDFMIFFDQDSSIGNKHVEGLIAEYTLLENKGYKVGCLGPVFFNTSRGEVEIAKCKKHLCENCYSVKSMITSSMICKYRDLRKIGFWNEEVFLDMADWDLCWRFIDQKYLCCVTKNVLLYHSVGEAEKKVFFLRLKIGKTFRDYYQVRDSLYLLKKKYVPLKFRIKLIQVITIRCVLRFFFLDDKRERLFYIKLGIEDFLKGKHDSLQ